MGKLLKALYLLVLFMVIAGCTETREEKPVPPVPNPHFHNLLESYENTPYQKGILPGLMENMEIARKHLKLAQKQTSTEKSREHLHHALNVIAGKGGEGYSGDTLDPGDGFGLLNYASEAEKELKLAGNYSGATENEKKNAEYALASLSNSRELIEESHTLAILAVESGHYEEVVGYANKVDNLLEMALMGKDANNNGEIEPEEGEGGIRTALEYVRMMEGEQ